MKRQSGSAALAILVLLTVLLGAGYTAFAVNRICQDFQAGRADLLAAQSAIASLPSNGNLSAMSQAAAELARAEQDFTQAGQRAKTDPALRLLAALPPTGAQVDAAAHLGAIGADLSRAGENAAHVGVALIALEHQYNPPLTPDELLGLVQRAQALAAGYKGSIDEIGRELQAAHAERAQVTTTDLLPQLRQAYADVDRALARADTDFARYQDVTRMLSTFAGITLSG